MGLLLLVPGLILWLVDASWFVGQDTVGLILTIVGGALILLQVVFSLGVLAFMGKQTKEVRRRW